MSHYFETPTSDGPRRRVAATIWGRRFDFVTAPGVFSGSRLDLGTAQLLRHVAPPAATPSCPNPRLLDLGCGFGAIAVALAVCCPTAEVTAVDVNDRALELTRLNAATARVTVRVAHPDDVGPEAVFDQIWSNPPIRIGKTALHELLQRWLARLAKGGAAYLVVGKNLGADSLQTWLEDAGWATTRLASAKGFRVLKVASSLS